MTISEEAIQKIEHVLFLSGQLDLDDMLILMNAVIVQIQEKSKLKVPAQVAIMTLKNRFDRRIKEGYVPDDVKARIERAIAP